MFSGEETNTNFTGLETTIYRTRGEYANHYTADEVVNNRCRTCLVNKQYSGVWANRDVIHIYKRVILEQTESALQRYWKQRAHKTNLPNKKHRAHKTNLPNKKQGTQHEFTKQKTQGTQDQLTKQKTQGTQDELAKQKSKTQHRKLRKISNNNPNKNWGLRQMLVTISSSCLL